MVCCVRSCLAAVDEVIEIVSHVSLTHPPFKAWPCKSVSCFDNT